jgi:mycothiol system anti-sigma-R factor
MADCNETIRELDAFLDGELSDSTRAMIHEHLGGCTDCLQAFEFHIELQQAIRRKCSNDVMPAGLLARIAACFEVDPAMPIRPDSGSDGARHLGASDGGSARGSDIGGMGSPPDPWLR